MNRTPDTELSQLQQELRSMIASTVRGGILNDVADRIEALPLDWELDPGRGDAVQQLRGWAQEKATAPLTVRVNWAGTVRYPDGSALAHRAVIDGETPNGISAELVVAGDDRVKLAALLDMEVRGIYATCLTTGCGTADDCDPSDPALLGWTRLHVAGTDDEPRWYCSPPCVSNALARAGDELAAVEACNELDGGL
ncbi:hypothetical protein [Streptomyces cylindrosporus]|uniref:Uncharacterized protein n=1 Tax=Streptomyces cylindrosporus TaxID=2927583 RepID=A0ABS9YK32_9ACTN|nr:hypothetical protein [Streptomyces cylindrosporus]MCI3277618.1 hypothetical protein [Streptomyces cylindrosporus]